MLKIYDSKKKEKVPFEPIESGKVSLYVCGMTVYDYCHLGHARVWVVFDTIVRYFKAQGFDVTYVRNITDIDDKIIQRAQENNESIQSLTERFISAMNEDAQALNVMTPDLEPKATESIDQIVDMIQALVDKGYAYQGDNGDVYYDVSRFEAYGALSGKRIEDLRAGERVEVNEAKNDPLDFVLWKNAKPGEPQWPSPWGAGRPGWHIECSAMSTHALGNHFDIHGGGMDLMFPHHENEIAQSEAATSCCFVNYWIHNGFVRVDSEKMSKSLGNFFTVRDLLKLYSPEVLRYFIVSSHYRSPLDYSQDNLDQAKSALDRCYTALRGVKSDSAEIDGKAMARFNEAMADDFNTPDALSVVFELVRELNRSKEQGEQARAQMLAATIRQAASVLGVLQDDAEAHFQLETGEGLSAEEIEALIEQRKLARAEKRWGDADAIRDQLQEAGVVLEDGAQGTTWKRVS